MVKKRLDDIADIIQGIPISRIRADDKSDLVEKTIYSFESESKILVEKDDARQKIPCIEENMIIFNIVSYGAKKAKKEDIGKIVASNYVIVKLKDKNINPDYLAWYMDQSDSFKRELTKIRQGSTVRSIPINEFRRMYLNLISLDKQNRIGKLNKLKEKRKDLFLERENLIGKAMITINEEAL